MKGPTKIVIALVFATCAGRASGAPPLAGQHLDCSDGGSGLNCASDDTGCVPDTKDHLKCSDAIAKAFSKAIASTIKCHGKQADAAYSTSIGKPKTFDEEACEINDPVKHKAAKEKLDAAIAKVASICTAAQLSAAAAEETTLFATQTNSGSLDALNGSIYCQGTADIDPGGDDAGKIPDSTSPAAKSVLKCEDTVGKNISKMIAASIKCHIKLADGDFKIKDFDEESCEGTNPSQKGARDKFNQARDKLAALNICPTCLNTTAQNTLATNVQSRFDTDNQAFYPCGAPTGCSCPGGTPTKLKFTTGLSGGTCGNLKNDTGSSFFNLSCGGLYFGGAGVGVPLPTVIPDMGASLVATSCTGSTLTLSDMTSAQTGSNRNCTHVGCLFGPPLPIPNGSHQGSATSTCVINTVSSNAAGTANCSTGDTPSLALPLSSGLFLTGDSLLPNRCSGGPTPGKGCTTNPDCGAGGTCVNDTGRCRSGGGQAANTPCNSDVDCTSSGVCETGVCSGGSNANFGCITDVDCPGGGSCKTLIQPCPICNAGTLKCNGGPNDGLGCTPADSAVNGDYPTSHDCPPPAGTSIGSLPIAFNLTTGTTNKTSVDYSTMVNVFCGFCGNSVNGQFKNPFVACTSDAGCTGLTGCPGATGCTKCRQRTSGAFTADDVARTITMTGSPAAGASTGGAAVPSKLVSIFCIPPTFTQLVDSAADLPGPGATALTGTTQLLP